MTQLRRLQGRTRPGGAGGAPGSTRSRARPHACRVTTSPGPRGTDDTPCIMTPLLAAGASVLVRSRVARVCWRRYISSAICVWRAIAAASATACLKGHPLGLVVKPLIARDRGSSPLPEVLLAGPFQCETCAVAMGQRISNAAAEHDDRNENKGENIEHHPKRPAHPLAAAVAVPQRARARARARGQSTARRHPLRPALDRSLAGLSHEESQRKVPGCSNPRRASRRATFRLSTGFGMKGYVSSRAPQQSPTRRGIIQRTRSGTGPVAQAPRTSRASGSRLMART
jgi:hypothetical protein